MEASRNGPGRPDAGAFEARRRGEAYAGYPLAKPLMLLIELRLSPLLRSSYPGVCVKRVWIAAKQKLPVMVRWTTDHELSRGQQACARLHQRSIVHGDRRAPDRRSCSPGRWDITDPGYVRSEQLHRLRLLHRRRAYQHPVNPGQRRSRAHGPTREEPRPLPGAGRSLAPNLRRKDQEGKLNG